MSQAQQASGEPSSQQTFNPSVNYCLDFITKLENRSAMVMFQLEIAVLTMITIHIGVLSLFKDLLSYNISILISVLVISDSLGSITGVIVSKIYLHIIANKALWALIYCHAEEIDKASRKITKYSSHDNYVRICIEEVLRNCEKINISDVRKYSNIITELYGRIGIDFKKLLKSFTITFVIIIIIIIFIADIMKSFLIVINFNLIINDFHIYFINIIYSTILTTNIFLEPIIFNMIVYGLSATLSGILYYVQILDR